MTKQDIPGHGAGETARARTQEEARADLLWVLAHAVANRQNLNLMDHVLCLYAAIKYIEVTALAGNENLAPPLRELSNALRDWAKGAKPPLLARRARTAGRPSNTSFGASQGAYAAALEILHGCGETHKQAAAWLVKEAKIHGLKPPKPAEVIRWKANMGGNMPDQAQRNFDQILLHYNQRKPDEQRPLPAAQEFARGILRALHDAGFG